MKEKLTDFNNYIRNHKSKEVTEPFLFEGSSQTPNKKGLMSDEIFGSSMREKRKKMGYVKLDGKYLHPLIYSRIFKRSMRKIDDLLAGRKNYKISKSGSLIEDEKGGTGIEFFYENYDKINLKNLKVKEDDSLILKDLKKVVKTKGRNEIFIDKFLILPLAFRDINTKDSGHISLDILNEKYKKLLTLTSIIKDGKDNPLFDKHGVRFRVQLLLVELLDFLMNKVFGKDGVMRRKVMSRNVDYTSRLVLSAPHFDSENFGEGPVNLDTAGLPLGALADMFSPFVINNMKKYLRQKFDNGEISCSEEEFEEEFSRQELQELIDTYVDSWGERFNFINVPGTDNPIKIKGEQKIDGEWESFNRPLTLTDLIYIATYFGVELDQKHDITTRYPVMDQFNTVPNKLHVLSTIETREVRMDGMDFKYYPVIDDILNDPELQNNVDEFESKVSSMFAETMNFSNLHLWGMNGDYDGDKVLSPYHRNMVGSLKGEYLENA
jgi:hypothetical protein